MKSFLRSPKFAAMALGALLQGAAACSALGAPTGGAAGAPDPAGAPHSSDVAGNDVASVVSPPKPILPKLTEPKVSSAPLVDASRFVSGRVVVELCEPGVNQKNVWPSSPPVAFESYEAEAFGFFELPHAYVDTGVRADRPNPLFVRAYAVVRLPGGRHRFLLRSRGASCLFLDGKPILTNPFPPPHSDDRPVSSQNTFLDLGPDFRFAPPGNREGWTELELEAGEHQVILETIVGGIEGKGSEKRRPEFGETVAAISLEGRFEWKLVGPGSVEVPYTDAGWSVYRKRVEAELEAADASKRALARGRSGAYWERRREAARQWLAATREVEVPGAVAGAPEGNAVDRFLAQQVAVAARQAREAKSGTVDFHAQIRPILESRCLDCHQGGRAKGQLRLDALADLRKGGKSGEPTVVPGHPESSALLSRVTSSDSEERMPPKGAGLSEAEVGLLRQWVLEGAHWPEFPAVALEYTGLSGDLEFLRRVTLDTVGVPPSWEEIRDFERDRSEGRRGRVIERLLADPRGADHWMGYWQDVLAENPNILNPTLNNTGPFRWWIYESLLDRKPLDLMVTELIRMKGSERFGGPAGFGVASQNDVPMAARGTVLSGAFLGVEMKCARCHDAPAHASKQEQLFQLAALLAQGPVRVPKTSSVPLDRIHSAGRKPLIEVTLQPGSTVAPAWPFGDFVPEAVADRLAENPEDSRDRLAALVTAPENERFAQVMVNRIWARLMGRGIVEPVSDWERGRATHPELLRWLGRELVRSGYQMQHVLRLILESNAYQREVRASERVPNPLYTAPSPRRLGAEQLVDSLFAVTGKPFQTEEASLDIDSVRTLGNSISLGQPRKAWMLTSTSNERDRPSLALPRIQAVADVLQAFGWRASRPDPLSTRDHAPNSLQPAILSNGVMGTWLTTLSDDHGITALALKKQSLEALLDELFLRILTRRPTREEARTWSEWLAPGFEKRFARPAAEGLRREVRRPEYYVSWSNHLDPDATVVRQKQEQAARRGDPPTGWLEPGWRMRMEDVLWSLLNAPEFVFTP
jgi:hypothetical protein